MHESLLHPQEGHSPWEKMRFAEREQRAKEKRNARRADATKQAPSKQTLVRTKVSCESSSAPPPTPPCASQPITASLMR